MTDKTPSNCSARILLVDDDPIVISSVGLGLLNAGYRVDTFDDGATALAGYQVDTPDLAILDIGLPDMSGTRLAAQMLEHAYRPIIMLSGHTELDIVNQAIGQGVVGYLVKPISAHQLIPSIETALARVDDINQWVAERLGETALGSEQISCLLDRFTVGLAIVDHNRNIVHQNQMTRSLIQQGGFITNRGGRLHALRSAAKFNDAIEQALDVAGGACAGALTLYDPSTDRTLQVCAALLGDRTAAPLAIVMMVDPDQPTPIPEQLLKTLYGLTTKESRLVTALCNGLTIESYCLRAHVSPNTARTHLKAIYRKTNTNRQVDLVRLMARFFGNISADPTPPTRTDTSVVTRSPAP